ncbi:MAG TPA: exodeoxyribonuclease VII small subunit [Candidatus Saccharimonadales bacterium]|nr:exodeoxyribonuclease VII small subunit [Candidatus Saccharimonadales bacterium]
MSNSDDKKGSFEEKLKELELIVSWFESEDVDLDKSMKKFEQGMQLAKELEKELKEAENKVEVIKRKFAQSTE